nr:putative ribonuclease H-like domain-containing protein [Tanacetum cinerariifolium]
MSSLEEIIFFLGLQVKQKNDGIFISQDKYVADILKKFGFTKVKNANTPMETQNPLLKDEDSEEVDVHMYRSMIGSLMYLTSSRPAIMFAVCACARYQVNLKVSHLHAVKRFLDEAVYKELDNSLVRAATTASSLETEQDSEVTLRSDKDRINELMKLCTNLQSRVIDLKKTKTTQALEIDSLKRRVKKLEKKQMSRTHKLKRLYKISLIARVDSSEDEQSLGEDASKQERKINDVDADEDITLVNDQDDAEMFDVNDLHGEEVFVEKEVVDKEVNAAGEVNAASIATTVSTAATITTEEVTLAKALAELKDDVQAKIDTDYQMAERLQAEEQQELSDKEKATLFMQLLEKRKKFFAAKKAEEKRNKPPTQAQQRKIMFTYLKNVEGKKLKDLKNKYFNSIKKMFDRAFKRVNTFVDFKIELVEGSSKRAREKLTQESSKKQKVNDDKETTELKKLMEIIPDKEEVAIDAIPLAVKSSKIVD